MTSTQHPAWCDATQCAAVGLQLHHSRALTVPATPGAGRDSATFILVVHGTHREQPQIELTFILADPGAMSPVLDVDADQLGRLRAALAAAGHVVGADQPHLIQLPDPDALEGGATP
ncbi:hypothetical protein [Dactylosporangium sp. NPDC051484]|uniref:hypothetical protein n=1 Tax=Dactylosporangium sp. NPDC051484 TaxID=3154942 RepID=UPI00344FE309